MDNRNLILLVMNVDGDWRGVPVARIINIYINKQGQTAIEWPGALAEAMAPLRTVTDEPAPSVIERINKLQGVFDAPGRGESSMLMQYAPAKESE